MAYSLLITHSLIQCSKYLHTYTRGFQLFASFWAWFWCVIFYAQHIIGNWCETTCKKIERPLEKYLVSAFHGISTAIEIWVPLFGKRTKQQAACAVRKNVADVFGCYSNYFRHLVRVVCATHKTRHASPIKMLRLTNHDRWCQTLVILYVQQAGVATHAGIC